ncbi:MAG: type VI secretion system contractile sheath large subunit [Paracoccaceae bacterium]
MSDRVPSFGKISVARPAPPVRDRFRIAVFGDFTGRAAHGVIETGAALAARRPVLLDVDTIEDVIEGFATTLILPIGKDGAGIEVKLGGLDDLHPDELYDNVEMFQALSGLRQRLAAGSMAEKATQELQRWGETFGKKVRLPKRSGATAVPADRRLSDFQALIGDTRGRLRQASPVDDLIARIVGPHVVAAPDPGASAMQAAVDDALGSAMRLILHHPEFQAVESQWRSLDLLARSIETDEALEIVLFDVSAEEIATDLAASDDLAESGMFALLRDAVATGDGSGAGTGGFSALFGLYTFEDTPPHAELLGRMAKVAAHVDAPFFTAISPAFLDQTEGLRHPLASHAWERLRALPEAAYLGVATPRFMLRRPYGTKSDPISAFRFEEFTTEAGLSGMLWANPVVLIAILLAQTYVNDGAEMSLGSVMALGGIPFHLITDGYGDQVALPCTERNLTTAKMESVARRGIMPVLSIKGRDEIRLASFYALGGRLIAGPWSGPARPDALEVARQTPDAGVARPLQPVITLEVEIPVPEAPEPPPLEEEEPEADGEVDTSLDDLLASFGEDDDEDEDGDMDAELAALLEDL